MEAYAYLITMLMAFATWALFAASLVEYYWAKQLPLGPTRTAYLKRSLLFVDIGLIMAIATVISGCLYKWAWSWPS